jgi:hypothetical protein
MMQTDSQGHDLDLAGAASVRYYITCWRASRTAPETAPASARSHAIRWNRTRPCGRCSSTSTPGSRPARRPPADCMPRLAGGTLVPPLRQEGYGFPGIPGVIYNGIHHTGDLFDSGPDSTRASSRCCHRSSSARPIRSSSPRPMPTRREDRAIELPSNLKGGAAHKVVAKLLTEGLVEEIRARGSFRARNLSLAS